MIRGWALSLVLSAIQVLGASSGVQAQARLGMDEELGSADTWTIGYNKSVSGCLASSKYSDGTTLWIGYAGDSKSFYIAVTNRNWDSIEPAKRYDLRFSAVGGGRWQGAFTGIAREGEKGVIATVKERFVSDLMRSAGIAVSLGARTITRLSLEGSSAAVTAVMECQRERVTANKSGSPNGRGKSSSGTGFFVTAEGHLLTNHHVIDNCARIYVQKPGDLRHGARVLASDSQNDLALVQTDIKPPMVAVLRPDLKLGENVSVFGFPLTDLLASSGNFTVGHVSAMAGFRDTTTQFQVSAAVQPGNSGGPVLDQQANVVGVISSQLNAMTLAETRSLIPQNVNFAIKSSTAISFLEANSVKPISTKQTTRLDTAEVAERAMRFTAQVLCEQ